MMDRTDKNRYEQALKVAAQLAVMRQAKFDALLNGDKLAEKKQMAEMVAKVVKTGELPDLPSLPEQQHLVKSIGIALKLYAAKEVFSDQPIRGMVYEAHLRRSNLDEYGGQPDASVRAQKLAELLLFTAADQLAIQELQQQTPSPISSR